MMKAHGLVLFFLAILVFAGVPGCATAGGSREQPQESDVPGPVEGTITEIETTSGGDQLLTLVRADGSEVFVEIPRQLADALRLQEGDRVTSEEETMVKPGERLRVQRLSVERG
jgi:hypothetical protein